MSNTLNTPVEALELSYPLRVERYELRRGLGRRRPAAWWRRRDSRASRARGLPALGARGAPHARPRGRGRRRARRCRPHAPERRGAASESHAPASRRRPAPRRDAGRRRLRSRGLTCARGVHLHCADGLGGHLPAPHPQDPARLPVSRHLVGGSRRACTAGAARAGARDHAPRARAEAGLALPPQAHAAVRATPRPARVACAGAASRTCPRAGSPTAGRTRA